MTKASNVAAAAAGVAVLGYPLMVTIQAGASDVWPWLAQLGKGRGGMYSYDWLENLFGAGIHTADRILPELQEIKPGDRVALFPAQEGEDVFLEVAVADRNRALVLRGPGTPAEALRAAAG